jgi:hypothetical protein
MEVKIYNKLEIPSDSAWDRFTIRSYIPNWILGIGTGIQNIFSWLPTIYKDRNWDNFYILEIMKKKLLRQRKYLIEHNRHMGIEQINRDMTIALNLIERLQEDYYGTEYQDYCDEEIKYTPVKDKPEVYELNIITKKQDFEPFIKKYKNACCKVVNGAYMGRLPYKKKDIAFLTSQYNQERANKLLYKILTERQRGWWD